MIIAMAAYPIDRDLHGTYCNGFTGTIHMNAVFKALYCKAVFWGHSISGSYILDLPLPIPKFFMETFKLHNDIQVPYLIWWFAVWPLAISS